MRRLLTLAAVLAIIGAVAPTMAQQYPARPIEFVIPFATGGPTDIAIRVIQPQLSANLGVPVVLVNKAGAGGALGMDTVAKAKPDGYTLAATTRSTVTIVPATQPDVAYRLSDFAVIGSYAFDSVVVLVKSGGPFKTMEELVEHARKNPGKVTYGSAGLGTNGFFAMEMIKQAYGIDLAHVPFGGSGPVKNAILGGHVPVGAPALSAVHAVIRSGDLFPLVSTASKRLSAIPTTPTIGEKGHPEASLSTWMEIYAPARTPKPIVDRLSAALEKTMKDPAVVAAVEKAGLVAEHHDPEEAQKLIERESEMVSRLAKKLNLGK